MANSKYHNISLAEHRHIFDTTRRPVSKKLFQECGPRCFDMSTTTKVHFLGSGFWYWTPPFTKICKSRAGPIFVCSSSGKGNAKACRWAQVFAVLVNPVTTSRSHFQDVCFQQGGSLSSEFGRVVFFLSQMLALLSIF